MALIRSGEEMMTSARLSFGASIIAIAMAAQAGAASAQTATAAPADEGFGVNEIIVTAQRRAQAAIDVPISIAAIGNEQLDRFQISELRDFVGQVPNLVVNNFNGRSDTVRLFIRGIGQNDVSLTQDPSVALYVDGIYVGTSVGAGFESDDIARVEVLRGPQGTLYGRNATGGAINIISTKPEFDGVHVKGQLSYGNYNALRGTATINLPVNDKLAFRFNGLFNDRDGLQENTGLGRDFAEINRQAFRAAVRFKPVDRVTFDYAFEYTRNRDVGTLTVPTEGAAIAALPISAPSPVPGTGGAAQLQTFIESRFTVPSPFVDRRPDSAQALREFPRNSGINKSHTASLEFEANDDLSFKLLYGHRNIDNRQFSDNLPVHEAFVNTRVVQSFIPQLPVGTLLNSIGPNGIAAPTDFLDFQSDSIELQAVGNSGFMAGSMEYVLGGFYYSDNAELDIISGAIGSGPVILQNFTTIANKSYAAFGEVTLRPFEGEQLSLTLGARYSHDDRKATRINERSFSFAALGGFTPQNCAFFVPQGFFPPPAVCNPTGVVQAATFARTFDDFSPSVTVAYRVDDDLNLYAKWAQGYKSGGTSQRSANPINFATGFEPENINSFEAGLKGRFFDNRVSASAAVFYMKLNQYQASVQTGATAGDRDFIGIDDNEFYGIEYDVTAAITRELSVSLSGAFLRAKLGAEFADVLNDRGQVVRQFFIEDQSFAPRTSLAAAVDYNTDIADDLRLGMHANVAYQSSVETSSNVADNRTIPGRAIVDLNGTITKQLGGDAEVFLRLWAKNLFDKEYKTVTFGSFAFVGSTTVSEFGEPRTYGATIGFKY
jgi:iron complex outermembrane receptor protein